MVLPQGDRDDPDAKIAPFKLHRGRLPVLTEKQWLAPINTEEIYRDGDPRKAVEDGIRTLYGVENVAFEWEDTIRCMGIYHAVPPAEEALQCAECHTDGTRMDWEALGYESDPAPRAGRRRSDS